MRKRILAILITLGIILVGCQSTEDKEIRASDSDPIGVEQENNTDADTGEVVEDAIEDAPTLEERVEATLEEMTLEEKVGQLFIVDLNTMNQGELLTHMDEDIVVWLETYPVGGIIFFGDNIVSVDQTTTLIQGIQESTRLPLFISVDEEGGLVSRIAKNEAMNATVLPGNEAIGLTGNSEYAYEVGQILGKELKALGFNMDFAPVADVNTNPSNPVIGKRAFGSEPELVSEMVAQMVEGIQSQQVSAVLKHFPGHGDTSTDSHVGTVTVSHSLERLRTVEWLPFKRGIDAGVDVVMTAHIELPHIMKEVVPSTLSKQMVTDYLRDELGFNGVVVTDALNMGAISNTYTMEEASIKAIEAGCDLLLMPIPFVEGYEGVLNAIQTGRLTEERIDVSVRRLLTVKYKRGLFDEEGISIDPEEVLGNEEHKQMVNEILSE